MWLFYILKWVLNFFFGMVADVSIRLVEENEENRGRKVLFLNLGFSMCVCLFTKKMEKKEKLNNSLLQWCCWFLSWKISL